MANTGPNTMNQEVSETRTPPVQDSDAVAAARLTSGATKGQARAAITAAVISGVFGLAGVLYTRATAQGTADRAAVNVINNIQSGQSDPDIQRLRSGILELVQPEIERTVRASTEESARHQPVTAPEIASIRSKLDSLEQALARIPTAAPEGSSAVLSVQAQLKALSARVASLESRPQTPEKAKTALPKLEKTVQNVTLKVTDLERNGKTLVVKFEITSPDRPSLLFCVPDASGIRTSDGGEYKAVSVLVSERDQLELPKGGKANGTMRIDGIPESVQSASVLGIAFDNLPFGWEQEIAISK